MLKVFDLKLNFQETYNIVNLNVCKCIKEIIDLFLLDRIYMALENSQSFSYLIFCLSDLNSCYSITNFGNYVSSTSILISLWNYLTINSFS